ncbi:MAG: hypothetical protein U0324_18715 [Polyangiales bacterium]
MRTRAAASSIALWTLLGCAAGDAASPLPDAAMKPDATVDAPEPDVPILPLDVPDVGVRCGDGVCSRGAEDCMSCPLDCNRCPTCDMAPSCTGALAVPLSTMAVPACNNDSGGDLRTNYACGQDLGVAPANTTCADPQLRIRIRELSIQRGFFDLGRQLFCVISAEDGRHSELLLMSPRDAPGNRNTARINLRPSEGTLWGQGDLYRSISNITVTYSCFLSSDGAAAQRVLDAIAGRAAMVSQHADGYGWVFGTVAVLGTILGSSLGTMRDQQVLDVQQTIAAGAFLPFTNGRSWEIRSRRGNLDLSGAWDLRLTLEAWGCAGVRAVSP